MSKSLEKLDNRVYIDLTTDGMYSVRESWIPPHDHVVCDVSYTRTSVLLELLETICDCDLAAEIDAGCDGEGPVAKAMIASGMAKTIEEANTIIFGKDSGECE